LHDAPLEERTECITHRASLVCEERLSFLAGWIGLGACGWGLAQELEHEIGSTRGNPDTMRGLEFGIRSGFGFNRPNTPDFGRFGQVVPIWVDVGYRAHSNWYVGVYFEFGVAQAFDVCTGRVHTFADDAITNEDVQRIKSELQDRSVKTVNNVLTVINKLLKVAVKWNAIERLPVQIELLKVPPTSLPFYDDFQYERLVKAAEEIDWRILTVVLLGGDAGLRCGEIIALEWSDIDFRGGSIHVQRSDWRGFVTVPKGGRDRRVPMTKRLAALLKANRQLGGGRILHGDRDERFDRAVIWYWMRKAQSRADLKDTGGVHILRHTFCSRLAIRGAPAKAIQELAGHANLGTTQRYMHLSPSVKDAAIALLDAEVACNGDILETGSGSQRKLQ